MTLKKGTPPEVETKVTPNLAFSAALVFFNFSVLVIQRPDV